MKNMILDTQLNKTDENKLKSKLNENSKSFKPKFFQEKNMRGNSKY